MTIGSVVRYWWFPALIWLGWTVAAVAIVARFA